MTYVPQRRFDWTMWKSSKTDCFIQKIIKKKGKCIRGRKHKHPILPGLYISPENTEKSTNFNLTKCSGDLFIACF